MRVLAAKFADREAALRVLESLRAAYDLGPHDAEVAPLGEPDDGDRSTVLAGRFHDARLAAIRDTISRAGGLVVADVDEGWTHPRAVATNVRAETARVEQRRARSEAARREDRAAIQRH